MPNSQTIPWKRIYAEGAAIVVSILLAFSIEAWWEDFQNRSEEQGILLSLKSEFEQNLTFIETEISYRNAVIQSILKIFDASVGRSSLQPQELDELIGHVTWWQNIDFFRGAIDNLLQSGSLSLIENEELRQILASMPSRYESTTRSELSDRDFTVNVVIPFLNSQASLSQIANTMTKGRPGTGLSSTPPIYPAGEPQDHSRLLFDQEFLGTLVQEHWNHLEANTAYASLKATLENAVQLIDHELED
jgi:hypothetical protein